MAAAKQNVNVLKADVDIAMQKTALTLAQLTYERYEKHAYDILVTKNSAAAEDVAKWQSRVDIAELSHLEAEAELERANLNYHSQIDGVNTAVASNEAQLRQARYYLDNTTLAAPEDGRIVNLQVRPGMVSGIYRIGGIAALIADAGRYLLATHFQENLKYVRPGQPVEVAFDLYPGQIFAGKVDSIWKANGKGQYLPSDEIPKYEPAPPTIPQGQYAVKIILDDSDPSKFPIGAQASAAIYTNGETGAWAALRKISIRAHSRPVARCDRIPRLANCVRVWVALPRRLAVFRQRAAGRGFEKSLNPIYRRRASRTRPELANTWSHLTRRAS